MALKSKCMTFGMPSLRYRDLYVMEQSTIHSSCQSSARGVSEASLNKAEKAVSRGRRTAAGAASGWAAAALACPLPPPDVVLGCMRAPTVMRYALLAARARHSSVRHA
eukprot:scaffold4414_cov135-Isochrysis_galbana.AAC.4